MDVSALPQLVRNTSRFGEVTAVLAKYGLASWLSDVRADWVQRLLQTADGKDIGSEPLEVRIRMAMTELGTTYIKLGQILSTRPDLIGPELACELSELQADAPTDSPEDIREVLQAELGQSVEEMFLEFDNQPMASASIAQVHRARRKDGQLVVIKVQHPGIEDRIQNDLEILLHLAQLAERFASGLKQLQPVATTREFSKTLLRELDFSREARNLQQFAQNFAEDPMIRFPTTYPHLSAKRVLTMELLQGTSLSDRDYLRAQEFDLNDLARRGATMFVDMIFRDGFYHADPHPGNLMVLAGNAIGVIDCGMVGRIDDDTREQIEDMLLAAVDQDAPRLTEMIVQLGQVPSECNRERLQIEVAELVADYRDQPVDEFDLSGALNETIAIIRRHRIILPSQIAMLLKVLIMLEGTSRQLSPGFSLVDLLKPYRDQAVRRRFSPVRLWKKMQAAYCDWQHLMEILPGDVSDILTRMKRGSFDIHLEHRRLETSVNRLVMGIITAALFIGSATLWSRSVPPVIGGYSIPGAVGCATAVILGWRLLRAIQRSGSIEG